MSRVIADPSQNVDALHGAFAAVYGIKDALTLLHTPPGCQLELNVTWTLNDLVGDSPRSVMTHLREEDFIFGAEQKVARLIIDSDERIKPGLIAVCPGPGSGLLVEDLDGVVDSIRDQVSCEVVVLPSASFSGDLFDGFSNSIRVFAERLPVETDVRRPRSVNVLGNFFHRYEGDEVGSVAELRRMIERMGVEVVSVFNEGAELARLQRAGEAEKNVVFPYGRGAAQTMEDRFGQEPIPAQLPIGLRYSCELLRKLGAAFGLEARAEQVIRDELGRTVPLIQRVLMYTEGRRFGLIVDPARVLGLLTYLCELGMIPALIGITKADPEIERAVQEELDKYGDISGGCEVLVDPARYEEQRALKAIRPDVVLGSSIDVWEAGALGIPGLGVTFPMLGRRFLHPHPCLGFEGALILAEDIANLFYVDTWSNREYSV